MSKVLTCERCGQHRECNFFGSAADDRGVQNGEWLCENCIPERLREADEAISTLAKQLEQWRGGKP